MDHEFLDVVSHGSSSLWFTPGKPCSLLKPPLKYASNCHSLLGSVLILQCVGCWVFCFLVFFRFSFVNFSSNFQWLGTSFWLILNKMFRKHFIKETLKTKMYDTIRHSISKNIMVSLSFGIPSYELVIYLLFKIN